MGSIQTKTIVLAAGKGTRMKSSRAKVLHEVFFAPMLHHVLKALAPMDVDETVVVTGHQAEQVEKSLAGYNVSFARQDQQLGTADAVLAAEDRLADFKGTILILCGDTPLIKTDTLQAMLEEFHQSGAVLSVMTTRMADPTNYGRIVEDEMGNLLRIVEEKDASPAEKKISEINAGIYCIDSSFLFNALKEVDSDNKQGEFYLTDLVGIARSKDLPLTRHVCEEPFEVLGINSRVELAEAHRILQYRRNLDLMKNGVTIIGPDTVDIAPDVVIGPDTEIGRNVVVSGRSVVGNECRIGANTIVRDSHIGDRVMIGGLCSIENCKVEKSRIIDNGTVILGKKE